jgi:hypothetical protein
VPNKQSRPVTRAHRSVGADQLRALPRDEVRKLCHGLLLADSVVINDYRSNAEMDEFSVTIDGLWQSHSGILRIYHRPIRQTDLEDVRAFAEATGMLESTVVCVQGAEDKLSIVQGVKVVAAAEVADRIVGSALVSWDEDRPSLATDRLEVTLRLAGSSLLDPVGLQWLPSLALNELPPALVNCGIEPQDLLERKAFRMLTASFRFGGIRYGEAARGKRLPDAVLDWPDGSNTSALLDCKAASSGYVMDADHLLRFINYWESLGPILEDAGRNLRYLVVLSSFFRGRAGEQHPYWNRAEELTERTGLRLAYITASDLAWAAARLETADTDPAVRCRLDWHQLLDSGLVTAKLFEAAVDEVLQ